MPYEEDGVTFYYFGENEAPAGAGKGSQDFKAIIESLKDGEKFEDPLFPASSVSLGENLIGLQKADGSPKDVQWKRPDVIAEQSLDGTSPIFSGSFDEFAINQGLLSDCWFLASLADVAVHPALMKMLVPEDNATMGFDKGIFHFRFWCRGKWIDIVVDDQLPCIMKDGVVDTTAFTRPTKTAGFWAPLLEKAYAKLYGNYKCIDLGYPTDALKDFTGGFIASHGFGGEVCDWDAILREAKETKGLVVAGMKAVDRIPSELKAEPNKENPGNESVSKDGIVCSHAYSALDIQDVKDADDKTITLVKLRNPWGNDVEWQGEFKDSDPIWETVTPNLRPNAEDRKADGEFWMPMEAFKKYVAYLSVCRWGKEFRGDKPDVKVKGLHVIQVSECFRDSNTVDVNGKDDCKGMTGYCVHLRPLNPDAGELNEDGFRCNSGLIINLMYEDYKTSGMDPSIPYFGFYLLWAPGELEPNDDFFSKVKIFKYELSPPGGSRDHYLSINLPAGTAFVAPWMYQNKTPTAETKYLLRIAAEGEILPYCG